MDLMWCVQSAQKALTLGCESDSCELPGGGAALRVDDGELVLSVDGLRIGVRSSGSDYCEWITAGEARLLCSGDTIVIDGYPADEDGLIRVYTVEIDEDASTDDGCNELEAEPLPGKTDEADEAEAEAPEPEPKRQRPAPATEKLCTLLCSRELGRLAATDAPARGIKLVLLNGSPTTDSSDMVFVWFGWDTLIKFERHTSVESLRELAQRLGCSGGGGGHASGTAVCQLDEAAAKRQWVDAQRVTTNSKPWRNVSEWKTKEGTWPSRDMDAASLMAAAAIGPAELLAALEALAPPPPRPPPPPPPAPVGAPASVPVAVAQVLVPMVRACLPQTSADHIDHGLIRVHEDAAKRQRLEDSVDAGGRAANTAAGAGPSTNTAADTAAGAGTSTDTATAASPGLGISTGTGVGANAGPGESGHQQAFHLTPIAPGWGLPPIVNDFTVGLAQLLSDEALEGALELQLHSYLLDLDFIVQSCPAVGRVPRIVVLYGDGVCTGARCLRAPEHAGRFVLLQPPVPGGQGPVFHPKMILVRSEVRLQLHITSANLTMNAFHNKTNSVWSGCFPPRTSPPVGERNGFEDDLLSYLEALNMLGSCPPDDFVVRNGDDGKRKVTTADEQAWKRSHFERSITALQRFDFGGARARLVASVPARSEAKPEAQRRGHEGKDLHKWGHLKVRKLLAEAGEACALQTAPLVMQFSSMSLNKNDAEWVREVAHSFCPGSSTLPQLQIVFPTTQEVRDSLEGWVAGVSIPNNSAMGANACIEAMNELAAKRGGGKTCLCRWAAGKRAEAVPHLKSFTRCSPSSLELPWVLTGSHNMSKAAWGQLADGGRALKKIRSYELSVLVLPSHFAATNGSPPRFFASAAAAAAGASNGVVAPLPFLPPTPYADHDRMWLSSSWRSNAITNALPTTWDASNGSIDRHGNAPEAWDGRSTESVIYGERCAGKRLLDSWAKRASTQRLATPLVSIPAGSSGSQSMMSGAAVVLMLDEDDPAFAAVLAAAEAACSDAAVHAACFQRTGTRHFTLLELKRIRSEEQMRAVWLSCVPKLPIRLALAGVLPLPGSGPFKNTIALGLDPSSGEQLRGLLAGIRGLPEGTSTDVNIPSLHLSLYRMRGFNFARAKPQFEQVRTALRHYGARFGSVSGTRIAIKKIGGEYVEGPDLCTLAPRAGLATTATAGHTVEIDEDASTDGGYDDLV